MPFVLNSQNNNLYELRSNGNWAIITQLPFDHEKLVTGDVYTNYNYPYVYIFGSFGTYLYNYRDDEWETRTTLPLLPGEAIVTGANFYDGHYILTTDGKIQEFNGNSPPSLLTVFPYQIDGRADMFFFSQSLYVSINNHSGHKMWQFNRVLNEWSEAPSFPEALNDPISFSLTYSAGVSTLYIANKKSNGNYDIWSFSPYE